MKGEMLEGDRLRYMLQALEGMNKIADEREHRVLLKELVGVVSYHMEKRGDVPELLSALTGLLAMTIAASMALKGRSPMTNTEDIESFLKIFTRTLVSAPLPKINPIYKETQDGS